MRGRDINRISMIGSTIAYCENNTSATGGITAFATALAKLKARKKELDKWMMEEMSPSTGVTTDVRTLRKKMSEQALRCANATLGYAHSVKNNELAEAVSLTGEDLRVLSKMDATDRCELIKNAASANISALADWGLTAGDITDLESKINAYRQQAQRPRLTIVTKSAANKKVKGLVRDTLDNLLKNDLDRMAETLRYSNREFWSGYKMAREIIDLGVRHSRVKGVVMDETDKPLTGIRFGIYDTETRKLLHEVVTSANGVFNVGRLPRGDFDFVWEGEGFEKRTESSVKIGLGKVLRRRVVMKHPNS